MSKDNNFIYVTGSKGGSGKSFIANALICYLQNKEKSLVRVIDTDDSNCDVGRVHANSLPTVFLPISEDIMSWNNLLRELEIYSRETDGKPLNVVVNGAARDNKAIAQNGRILNKLMKNNAFPYDFTTLWVASNVRDSFDLLLDYLQSVTVGRVVVLLNGFYGGKTKFEYFNKNYDSVAARVEAVGLFPSLNKDFADALLGSQSPIVEFADSFDCITSKLIFEDWLEEAFDAFKKIGL